MNKIVFVLPFLAAAVAGGAVVNHYIKPKALASTPITRVSILATSIEPSVVFVKVGEQVQFDSKDGKSHNIEQGEGNENGNSHDHMVGGVQSGIFGKDEAYRAQITQAGTYNFHDHLNPNLVLTVVAYNK